MNHDEDEPTLIELPEPNTLEGWMQAETEHIPNLHNKDMDTFYAYNKHPITGATLDFSNMQKKG